MTGRTLEEIEALAAEATLLPLSLDEIVDRLAAVDRSKVDGVSWRTIDLVIAIAQGQREELARLKARYAWIDSGFGDLDFHREEVKHKGPKRGCKASYYWMRIGVEMVTGGRRLVKSDDAKDAEPVADGIHSPYFDDDWRG